MLTVSSHGVDTVRVTFSFPSVLPVDRASFQRALILNGFLGYQRASRSEGEVATKQNYTFRDEENPTLRCWIYGGDKITAEFSAARFASGSALNLDLVPLSELQSLITDVIVYVRSLIPGSPEVVPYKLRRLDYACDIAAGAAVGGVLDAASHFHMPRSKKATLAIYPHESVHWTQAHFSFCAYVKGLQLEQKLNKNQRIQYAKKLKELEEAGVIRLETKERPKGGFEWHELSNGLRRFVERLKVGFPGEGRMSVMGLRLFEEYVSSLGLSAQEESTMLAFGLRYVQLHPQELRGRYKNATYHRHKKQFKELGLCPMVKASFEGELDFRAIFETILAADK